MSPDRYLNINGSNSYTNKYQNSMFILKNPPFYLQFLSEGTACVSIRGIFHVCVAVTHYNSCIYANLHLYSLSLTANLQKLQTSEDTVITVDAKAAGKGKVTCKVQTPQGMELDMDVVENRDGTFDIYYTAPEPGKYVITIRFGGQNIPKSPFHVVVGERAFIPWPHA